MNGHDTYFDNITWEDQEKEFDDNGDEIVDEPLEEENELRPGNMMIDRDQDEIQHEWAREAHSNLMETLSFNQDDR